MAQTLKTGTRIETLSTQPERAVVARWSAVNGRIKNHVGPNNGGWHIIRFENGGKVCMHETGFRVLSNH